MRVHNTKYYNNSYIMKKSLLILFAGLCLFSASCKPENKDPEGGVQTTASIIASKAIGSWAQSDQLLVLYRDIRSGDWATQQSQFSLTSAAGSTFSGTVKLEANSTNHWAAFYPYNAERKIIFNENLTQNGYGSDSHIAPAMPLCGYENGVTITNTPNIHMTDLGAVVKVTLKNSLGSEVVISDIVLSCTKEIAGTYIAEFKGEVPTLSYAATSKKAALKVENASEIAVGQSVDFYFLVKPFALEAGQSVALTVKTDKGDQGASVSFDGGFEAKAGALNAFEAELLPNYGSVNGVPFLVCEYDGYLKAEVSLSKDQEVTIETKDNIDLTKSLSPTFWKNVSGNKATFKGQDGTYNIFLRKSTNLIYTEFPEETASPVTYWLGGTPNGAGHPGADEGTLSWNRYTPAERLCVFKTSEGVYEIDLYLTKFSGDGGFQLYNSLTKDGAVDWNGIGGMGYTIVFNGSSSPCTQNNFPMPVYGRAGVYHIVFDINAKTATYTTDVEPDKPSEFTAGGVKFINSSVYGSYQQAQLTLSKDEEVEFTGFTNLAHVLQSSTWVNVNGNKATFKGPDGTYMLFYNMTTGLLYTEVPIDSPENTAMWIGAAFHSSCTSAGNRDNWWEWAKNTPDKRVCMMFTDTKTDTRKTGIFEADAYVDGTFQIYINQDGTKAFDSRGTTVYYNGEVVTYPSNNFNYPAAGGAGKYHLKLDLTNRANNGSFYTGVVLYFTKL